MSNRSQWLGSAEPDDAQTAQTRISAWEGLKTTMERFNVTALVDWNAQMHNWGLRSSSIEAEAKAKRALELTARVLSRALVSQNDRARYFVSLRLYHGWTKGYQDQPSKVAIRSVAAGFDFAAASKSRNVAFDPNIGYGDLLLSARNERMNMGKRIHLPGTLRVRDRGGRFEEKMVDTALATDLLTLAQTDPGDWSIVLAEDDDLVPPLFTAELWKERAGGKVFLMQKRTPKSRHVDLSGLLLEGTWNDRA